MAGSRARVQRVLIIHSELKHYRIPFFNGLYNALQQDGIELRVAYSNSHDTQALRKDRAELPAPVGCKVKGRWFLGRLLYQNLWREIAHADLVITGPELKYLVNPFLLLMSALRLKIVAFWGLGPYKHPDHSPAAEWIKRHFFTRVDWWFAYTESIAAYLRQQGMPTERITVVQNATDTAALRNFIDRISDEDSARAKEAITSISHSRVCLYCGLIGEVKSIPLLLDAARLVKRKYPEFHLVLIGDGPDRKWLETAIKDDPWIHYCGFKNHAESAVYYKMADVFVIAGTVGLAVVDCFAAGLPLIATHLTTHPPEISYVVPGVNGLLVPHAAPALADGIDRVLSNSMLLETLIKGAKESGSKYTMDAMISNFRAGVVQCLAQLGPVMALGNTDVSWTRR
jgi:glycosyltransferase involved in cell wall biosynthesis